MLCIIVTDTICDHILYVNTIEDVYTQASNIFNYYDNGVDVLLNDVILDINKTFEFYGIGNNDMLLVTEKKQMYEIEDMDILNYTHLYLLCEIENYNVSVMIDSGATMSVVSHKIISTLGLDNKINKKFNYTMRGIGQSECIGIIHNLTIKINNIITQVSLHVIEDGEKGNTILFGLDVLNKHKCIIDIPNRLLHWNDNILKCLNETDVAKYRKPVYGKNNVIANIKNNYVSIVDNLDNDTKTKFNTIIKKIIDNVINNGHDKKYLTLPKAAKMVNECIIGNNANMFMESIGFIDTGDKFEYVNMDNNNIDVLKSTLEIINNNMVMAY